MFKSIGAFFREKSYTNFGTPLVTEDTRNPQSSYGIEHQYATRVFDYTPEGDIVAAVFSDVFKGEFFNLATGAGFEFQNFYDTFSVFLSKVDINDVKYEFTSDGRKKEYYFTKINDPKNADIMIYNPSYRKCIIMYPLITDDSELYMEYKKDLESMQVGFISKKEGISGLRTRHWCGFIVKEKKVKDLEEAKAFYKESKNTCDYNLEELSPFNKGGLIDGYYYNE